MTDTSPDPRPEDALYESIYPSGPPADTLTPDERALYDQLFPPHPPEDALSADDQANYDALYPITTQPED